MLKVKGTYAVRRRGGSFNTTMPVQPCFGCGTDTALRKAKHVRAFHADPVILVREVEAERLEPSDDMGVFPVCRDCATRFAVLKPYLM